ncbi:hypothetical protein [Nocardia sp. NPDC046763]|uniref:hypothetical protein n=1 Tax=Nocardia sp. NPDC046763 TaxID=3155256 RepID=UPI0033DBB241
MAPLVGPIIGGILVDGLGWKWIFLVNVHGALIPARLAAHGIPSVGEGASGSLSGTVQSAFSAALVQSMVLLSAVLIGGIAACLLLGHRTPAPSPAAAAQEAAAALG